MQTENLKDQSRITILKIITREEKIIKELNQEKTTIQINSEEMKEKEVSIEMKETQSDKIGEMIATLITEIIDDLVYMQCDLFELI